MGLDVWLTTKEKAPVKCWECGFTHEITKQLFEANITYNLGKMAEEAGMYDELWRPFRLHSLTDNEDFDSEVPEIIYAKEVIPGIKLGLKNMKSRPEHYKKFNSENGWGLYKNFVPWLEKYLKALEEFPESIVNVDR